MWIMKKIAIILGGIGLILVGLFISIQQIMDIIKAGPFTAPGFVSPGPGLYLALVIFAGLGIAGFGLGIIDYAIKISKPTDIADMKKKYDYSGLIKALKYESKTDQSETPNIRMRAIFALEELFQNGGMGDAEFRKAEAGLILLLKNDRPDVQAAAVNALRLFKTDHRSTQGT
jgi:hypothetical protein